MDDAPKSAVELAMARFKRQDTEQGVTETPLTDDQKAAIAEVRRTVGAKLAQEEILFKSKIMSVFDPEERERIQDHYRRDVERLTHERDRKIEKIHQG